jgi:hypothetical protein
VRHRSSGGVRLHEPGGPPGSQEVATGVGGMVPGRG